MRKLLPILLLLAACDTPTTTSPDVTLPTPNLKLGLSGPDASGCRSGWVDFPGQPVTVFGGSEDRVYRKRFTFTLPSGYSLTGVSSFIGTDAGDRFEADLELVSVQTGARIYQRSEHRRGEGYDAWKGEIVRFTCPEGQCEVEVILLGRVTDTNMSPQNLASYEKLRARFHFGLRMELCTVGWGPAE